MLKKTIKQWLDNLPPHTDTREAEIILAQLLNKNQIFILAHPEYQVPFLVGCHFYLLLKKRIRGWPLAYLTGHKEFFSLDFLVNKHTLVPRPETEILVELALEIISQPKVIHLNQKILLIDIGTGTGCIPISIVKNSPTQIAAYALDISTKALEIARDNAKKNNVQVNFLPSDLLTNFPLSAFSDYKKIVITANLPYLTHTEFYTETSIKYEPKTALIAAENGLALYFQLIKQLKNLAVKNRDFTLLCEINPSQVTPLTQALLTNFPNAYITTHPDLAGLNRVVRASWQQ